MSNTPKKGGNQRFRLTKDGKIYFKGKRTYANLDVYDGEFVENMRHGVGVMKYFNGDRYEGEWSHNKLDGFGVYIWNTVIDDKGNITSGKRYEGDWKNGKMHGRGYYVVGNGDIYSGVFKNGVYDGKGTLKLNNGDVYAGDWLNGHPSGDVKVKYSNGDEYEGIMLLGRFHSKGKYTYCQNKGYYDGTWEKGVPHGRGVRIYADSSKYVGEFFEGEVDGEGMMFYASGDQYLGHWKMGHKDGKGVMRFNHGESYEGSFMEGYMYGQGKYQYKDGGYYQGDYKNIRTNKHSTDGIYKLPRCDGKRHGYGVRLWSNGTKYEGVWVENKMHGKGVLTSKDKGYYEGMFWNGLKHGMGVEHFGNEFGIDYICPLGYKHIGTGYCTYTGQHRLGFFHGQGEFMCSSGPYYKGEWFFGMKHGQGHYSYLKNGEMGDGKRLCIGGIDSLYRTKEYQGSWVENKREGYGIMTYTNGDTIEGNFLNGLLEGTAVYKFINSGNIRYARYARGYRQEWIQLKTKTKKSKGKEQKKRITSTA
eukprot:gene5293-7355_t